MTEPSAPAEGWYPDPAGGAGLRWWTGIAWTDATRPAAPPLWSPVSPGPSDEVGHDEPTPARRRTVTVVVAALLVLVLVAAVVGGLVSSLATRSTLDTAAIESGIAARLTERTGSETTVDCPAPVTIEAGTAFVCTATAADGTTTTVTVHQDDDQGDVTWSVTP